MISRKKGAQLTAQFFLATKKLEALKPRIVGEGWVDRSPGWRPEGVPRTTEGDLREKAKDEADKGRTARHKAWRVYMANKAYTDEAEGTRERRGLRNGGPCGRRGGTALCNFGGIRLRYSV